MTFDRDQRRLILKATDGKCHLCGVRVTASAYGKIDHSKGWEVDHSKAQARGGTHHGNNLRAACISCNRSKQARGSKAVRRENGLTRSPPSKVQQRRERIGNAVVGGSLGVIAGAILAGPLAPFIAASALLGYSKDLKR